MRSCGAIRSKSPGISASLLERLEAEAASGQSKPENTIQEIPLRCRCLTHSNGVPRQEPLQDGQLPHRRVLLECDLSLIFAQLVERVVRPQAQIGERARTAQRVVEALVLETRDLVA